MNPGVMVRNYRGVAAALATLIAFATLMAFAQSAPVNAQTQTPGTISGTVTNATEGSDVPIGMMVRLFAVDETTQAVLTNTEVVVGTNGQFSFTGYPVGDNITYRVVADDGSRHTPSVDLRAGEGDFSNVQLTIWDTTDSLEDISVSRYSILVPAIDGSERMIGVLAVASISNNGDEVWVADVDSPTLTGLDLLRFNLPEGFQQLSVESDLPFGNILEIGTGFAMTNPVPPGNYDILMTYGIEYSGDSLDFPLRLPYGADEVRFLLPQGSGTVSGVGLESLEPAEIDDVSYNIVSGTEYPRDSQLDVKFESLPQPAVIDNLQDFFDSNTMIFVIVIIVAVIILALLVYALFYSRKSSGTMSSAPAGGAVSDYPEYSGLDRSQIVSAIAELDERHDSGEIDGAEYGKRREALKHAALSARKNRKS